MSIGLLLSVAIYAISCMVLMPGTMYTACEFIIPFLIYIPTYLYGRSNKAWSSICVNFMTFATIARYPYIKLVLGNGNSGDGLVRFNILYRQASGIVLCSLIVLYLLFIWLLTTRIIKDIVNKSNVSDLATNSRFTHMRNLMYTTVHAYIISLLISCKMYRLSNMWISMIVLVIVAVSIQVSHTMYCKSLVKERQKELDENNKSVEEKDAE